MTDPRSTSPDQVRLDRWLWAARFFKTRALAAEAVDRGRVEVEESRVKRSRLIRVGDSLRIRIGPVEWHIVVEKLSVRRGSASVAAELYRETPQSAEARSRRQAELEAIGMGTSRGAGRPSKKNRRDLLRFRRRS